MSQGIVTALKAELHKRISLIEQLLANYSSTAAADIVRTIPMRGAPLPDSKEGKAKREVLARLAAGPASRTHLFDMLTAKKIIGHEEYPMKSLSKFLARWPEVQSDGKGTWSLRPSGSET